MAKKYRIVLSNEELLELKNYYLVEKLSLQKISKIMPYGIKVLKRSLEDENIEIVNRQNDLKYDIVEDIIPLYESGLSLTKIAKQFNTTVHTLSRHLKRHGVEIINHQNKTKFNQNIFDSIDTEEKAYWLGFIYADGYVASSTNHFELSLGLVDVDHLIKFNSFVEHNKDNVKVDENRCRWYVVNKHLKTTLNNYGCTPNKSLTLKFPDKNIFKSEDLIKHFMRGYFDGDGSITYSSTTRKRSYKDTELLNGVCTMIGTEDLLKSFLEHVNIKTSLYHDNRHSENTFYFRLNNKDSIKLMKYLYDDSNIYLNRKLKLANFFKNGCRSFKELKELLSGNIEETPTTDDIEINSEIAKGSESL